MLEKQSRTPCLMAASRGAVSRIMLGDLPPSSCATRLTVSAAALATSTPARVEPVNDTMSMSGCPEIAAPTPGPSPLTRLKTPAGAPADLHAASMISARMVASMGAISLGLSTTVHPAARAGATLQATWFSGQFQGVIRPHTPIGSRRTTESPARVSNSNSLSAAAATPKCAAPSRACAPWDSFAGAPISAVMAAAKSARRSLHRVAISASKAARFSAGQREYSAKAARAALTAWSTSSRVP